MPLDIERATYALNEALMPYIVAQTSFDDVDDTVEFLVTEIQSSGIELASDVKDDVDTRTLEELEAHPLTSILRTHLCNLMDVPANDVPFILEAFLDTYQRGMPEVDEEEDDDRPNERICELCERPAPLTVHHLIPRSEHALMIKRGIFTQTECQKRLSMLCRPCHSACHRSRSTRELAVEYNTVEKLLEIPEVAKFAEWNSKRKVLVKAVLKRKRR